MKQIIKAEKQRAAKRTHNADCAGKAALNAMSKKKQSWRKAVVDTRKLLKNY